MGKEKPMKKIVSLLLILTMILMIVGCSSKEEVDGLYDDPGTETNISDEDRSLTEPSLEPTDPVTPDSSRSGDVAATEPKGTTATETPTSEGTSPVIGYTPEYSVSTEDSHSSSISESKISGSATKNSGASAGKESAPGAEPVKNKSDGGEIAEAAESEDAAYVIDDKTEKKGLREKTSPSLFDMVSDGSAGFGDYDYGDYGDYDYDYGDWDDGEIWITDPVDPIIIDEPIEPYDPGQISAGLLTAGEWNDNRNFYFIRELIANGQSYNYSDFFTKWGLSPFTRVVVRCTAAGTPVQGAKVEVSCASSGAIYKGVSDHNGMCYVYYSILDQNAAPTQVTVKYGSDTQILDITPVQLSGEENIEVSFGAKENKTKKLDLMFTIDTTGSMGDEIRYLQKELENVIVRVRDGADNIPIRLSVNFYRDHGDAYVVRSNEFTTDIDSALSSLAREYAYGGGDYEEAVELALEDSIGKHAWDEDSVKIMFMVLDAPPHNTSDIRESLHESIMKASEMGIRIIPIASSGVDKDTEFLLRAFAMATGGTYTFLTDDSGIGGSHLEPTVGDYEVEQLNDMLVRIIEDYIG